MFNMARSYLFLGISLTFLIRIACSGGFAVSTIMHPPTDIDMAVPTENSHPVESKDTSGMVTLNLRFSKVAEVNSVNRNPLSTVNIIQDWCIVDGAALNGGMNSAGIQVLSGVGGREKRVATESYQLMAEADHLTKFNQQGYGHLETGKLPFLIAGVTAKQIDYANVQFMTIRF
jgi:hypothetical protein